VLERQETGNRDRRWTANKEEQEEEQQEEEEPTLVPPVKSGWTLLGREDSVLEQQGEELQTTRQQRLT